MSEQLSLFAAARSQPDGLRYAPDFVSASSEQALIERVEALPLEPFQFGQFQGHRRVAWFGYRYDYTLRRLQQAEPIPGWLSEVVEQIEAFGGANTQVAQVLCTSYDVGVGIGWHRDKPHFGEVFGLSLGSACKFRFRRRSGESWERFTLEAEPRSLYLMTGASRHVWEHSIPPVAAPRWSITFRTMAEPAS